LIISPKKIEKNKIFSPILPISKSQANRLLILHFIGNLDYQLPKYFSESKQGLPNDVYIMDKCLQRLNKSKHSDLVFNVEDAGTVARFLTALLSTQEGTWEVHGNDRMHQRPMGELINVLRELGAEIHCVEKEGFLPIKIKGKKLNGGNVKIKADISSQYISALLLITPLLKEKLILEIGLNPVSLPYIDLTIDSLRKFDIDVERKDFQILASPSKLILKDVFVEKDWSSAAVWFSVMLTGKIDEAFLEGLNIEDKQGDTLLLDIYNELGISHQKAAEGIRLIANIKKNIKKEYLFDLQGNPDLFPYLVVSIILSSSSAKIVGLKNLDLKESKRLTEVLTQMNKNAFHIEKLKNDSIKIYSTTFKNNKLSFDCKNDHRLIMAFSIFGLICSTELINTERVAKSYPDFWNEMEVLIERSISNFV
jgi:3-phosphoshikimate 1-carboxyvinyltransferase